jgi:hypothetical protein
VQNDANVTTWTTWGGPLDLSDFVGLSYAQPQVFGLVKVDLGWQFFDGGDWAFQPQVFILKNPLDTNQKWPETDPTDWVAVPATLLSDNVFDLAPDAPAGTVPLPNSPIAFDLSHLPLAQRTGWGWAVGGVPGNGPTAEFVSIAELCSFGVPASAVAGLAGAPQILLDVTPQRLVVPAGFPLQLAVPLVVGSPPLSYQWQCNGAGLRDSARLTGSQSNVLAMAWTAVSDSGNYRLLVTNAFGAATSAVASVTFVPAITFNYDGAGWVLNTRSRPTCR